MEARALHRRILAHFPLGSGEAEALALAISQKARLLTTDDEKAMQASRLLKIPFTTAVNLLARMHEKGLLEKTEAYRKLDALRKHGRYTRDIIEDARSEPQVR